MKNKNLVFGIILLMVVQLLLMSSCRVMDPVQLNKARVQQREAQYIYDNYPVYYHRTYIYKY